MKTIKIIDLLNKIANGEEVPKVKFDGEIYEFCTTNFANNETGKMIFDFYIDQLNNEVEIIEEEKKIEKLYETDDGTFTTAPTGFELMGKINELIDAYNELKKNK